MQLLKSIKIQNIVLLLISSTMFICCQNDLEKVNQITETRKLPAFEIENFETVFSDSGIVQVRIFAPKLSRFDKKEINYDEYPKGINADFYNPNMEIEATLRCSYARYLIDKDLWEAKFDVEVNNLKDQKKLNTELMYWDVKKELIYSDKFVKVTTPEEVLFGEGFEANQDFSKFKITKTTGSKNIKDE